jgi:serine/threonine-protein kinase
VPPGDFDDFEKSMKAQAKNSIIAGKYRLVGELGSGAMGSVWRAEHLTLRSHVAIKLIHLELVSTPDVIPRFLREAQAAALLRSPHVVQILDHGIDNGTPYIAMELLEGENLAARLDRVGRLDVEETARIVLHLGRAIGRAHDAGIVHRDLKPDNIFLVKNDDEEIAKVLDFGIAKSTAVTLVMSPLTSTRNGAVMGTPHYMSPEQTEGTRDVDHRTDIWAMGVIAYECLVGARPFDRGTLGGLLAAIRNDPLPVPSTVADVPPGFDEWFARACARELEQRFQSARDASLEFRAICGVEPVNSDHLPSAGEKQIRSASQRPKANRDAAPGSVNGLSATQNRASVRSLGRTQKLGLFALALILLAGGFLSLRFLTLPSREARVAPASAASSAGLATAQHASPAAPSAIEPAAAASSSSRSQARPAESVASPPPSVDGRSQQRPGPTRTPPSSHAARASSTGNVDLGI